MRILSPVLLSGWAAVISLGLADPARSLSLSASSAGAWIGGTANTIGLPAKTSVLVPVPPFVTSLPSLAAPTVPSSTNTDGINGFGYGNASTAVQFSGDAQSSITFNGGNSYDIDLVLTNFFLTTNPISTPTHEYYYLNIWETFTGLPTGPLWSGTGNVSINGFFSATSPLETMNIEPIASVLGTSTWQAASAFFNPQPTVNGPFASSTPIFTSPPLASYISGGNLTVGLEAILIAFNQDMISGDVLQLPTSLELKVRYEQVPAPLPAAGAALAWSFSRRLRRRLHLGR